MPSGLQGIGKILCGSKGIFVFREDRADRKSTVQIFHMNGVVVTPYGTCATLETLLLVDLKRRMRLAVRRFFGTDVFTDRAADTILRNDRHLADRLVVHVGLDRAVWTHLLAVPATDAFLFVNAVKRSVFVGLHRCAEQADPCARAAADAAVFNDRVCHIVNLPMRAKGAKSHRRR